MAVAALAFGWWVFRTETPSVRPANQAGPAVPLPVSSAPVASTASTDSYRTAGRDELLALLRQKLQSGSDKDALAALAEIAKDRPELAISLANELGRTNAEKTAWVQEVVKQWAGRSPEQAWGWLAQPTNPLANSPLLGVVMDAMATSNPEMLLGHVDALLVQNDKSGSLFSAQNAVYYGLQALVKSGNLEIAQATVEAWANDPNKLPVGPAAYEIVVLAMDQKAPETAATWLRSLPASDDRNSAIGTFAFQWGQNDPLAAMHWAQTLTPQEGQPDVVGRIFSEWIQNNPETATNWLEDYLSRTPDDVADDMMIGSLVLFSPTAKNDPNEALKLADSIVNPQTRSIYQQQIFQSWGRTDPGSAVEYVMNSTTLDPDQKKMLIQQIQDASSPSTAEQ